MCGVSDMTDEKLIARLRKADEYEPLGHDGWEAADRIEQLLQSIAALTEQLAAARKDAEEAEAYAGELEANGLANRVAIMRLEAKLAKVTAAYRLEAMKRDDYSHDAFDKHLAELSSVSCANMTGGKDGWECPIGYEGCTKNCGSYSCGN